MRRREFLAGICAAAGARTVHAQSGKIAKVGILWHAANAQEEEPYFSALKQGFSELGYVEGRNLLLEHRFPDEQPDRFRAMAAELVAQRPDVLVAIGANASPYAKQATGSVPIVFVIVPDPVGSKLVQSLARPGGNATGLSTIAPELTGKRLELLKEAIPEITRVALLINSNAQISEIYVQEARAAAGSIGLQLEVFDVRLVTDLPNAFKSIAQAGIRGAAINQEGLFFVSRRHIARLALEHHVATCVWSPEVLKAGALISYGPNLVAICRRAAVLVQKILKGENPSDIPVEQPTKYELGVNLGTAKSLGITLPSMILGRADEVIE